MSPSKILLEEGQSTAWLSASGFLRVEREAFLIIILSLCERGIQLLASSLLLFVKGVLWIKDIIHLVSRWLLFADTIKIELPLMPSCLGIVAFKEIVRVVVNQVDGLEATHHINTCHVLTVVYSSHVALHMLSTLKMVNIIIYFSILL